MKRKRADSSNETPTPRGTRSAASVNDNSVERASVKRRQGPSVGIQDDFASNNNSKGSRPTKSKNNPGSIKREPSGSKPSSKIRSYSGSPEIESNVSVETLTPRKRRGLLSTPTKPRNVQHTTPNKPLSTMSPGLQARLTPNKKVNGSDMLTPAKRAARAVAEEIAEKEEGRILTRGAQRRGLDSQVNDDDDASEEEENSEEESEEEEEDEDEDEPYNEDEEEEPEMEAQEDAEGEKADRSEPGDGEDVDQDEIAADENEHGGKNDQSNGEPNGRMLTRGASRNHLGNDLLDYNENSDNEEESEPEDDEEGEGEDDNEESANDGVKRIASESLAYVDFFQRAARKKKSLTSNNTLSQLPTLTAQEATSLLASIPDRHADHIKNLHDAHRQQFTQWKFETDCGYNILLFGYGSKRNLIEAFGREELAEEMSVLVINGYFPNLSLDSILSQILAQFAPKVTVVGDKLNLVHQHLSDRLALLIHSLDSPLLRLPKNQQILSSLASNQYITVVASVDHLNAPLLFDSLKASRYNFLWHDATTFVPLRKELSFEVSTYLSGGISATSSVGGLSGIKNVLNNLTSNSRALYLLLLQHQLPLHTDGSNPGGHDQGITFPQLRALCAKKILPLSNPITLNGVLTEFFDHGLIAKNDGKGNAQTKKSRGGGEVLWAPFEKSVISEVIEFLDA
jgi:origin recognition complex subunit 2